MRLIGLCLLFTLAACDARQREWIEGLARARAAMTITLNQEHDFATDDNLWSGVMYEEIPPNNAGDYSFTVAAVRQDTHAFARWNVDGGVQREGTGDVVLKPSQPLNVVPIHKDLGMSTADFRVRPVDIHITAEIKGLDGVETRWKVTRGSVLTYNYNPTP